MKKRVHVYYNGMVQGVGFRFTAERIARQLNVAGWVKNLPTRGVELVAEGEEEVLKGLLKKIKYGVLKHYIEDAEVSWSEPTGEFEGFDIKFW